MSESKNHAGDSTEESQSVPDTRPAQESVRPAQAVIRFAYLVIGLLYLSFILHITNSQAVTGFISEVRRLLEKFVF